MEKIMGLLKFTLAYVVFVSMVTNSHNTQNETEVILNRTKRYHEPLTSEVNRPKKGNPVPLKSYIVENSAPVPKVPVIKPRLLNLRLDNNVNTMPRKIVQIKEQPKKTFIPTNNLTPLNHYYIESKPAKQNKPSSTKSITEIHAIDIKNKEPKHNEKVLIPKHDFYEDDIDYDEVNKMNELKKSVEQKHITVNTETLPKQTDAYKLEESKSTSEPRKNGISESYEHKTDMDPNIYHIGDITVDNTKHIENILNVNVPEIPNMPILNVTKIEGETPNSNKSKSNLSVRIPKNDSLKQHEQKDNHSNNRLFNIDDATQCCDKDVKKNTNYTEIESHNIAVTTNINDKENGNNVKSKPSVNPIKDMKNEATGNIVIKNRTFEEVHERSNMNTPGSCNVEQNQDVWTIPQLRYNAEWTPYYYYYDQYQNANYGTNEESIYKPDFTYTKPPYQYPCEGTINLNYIMDKNPKYYDITNKIPDYKDRVWRKWKDVEICIKPSENKPVSVEIEQKPSDADDTVENSGLKTTIFNGFRQGVIGCDGYYNGNYNMATWYPYCYYPSYSYVY